MRLTHNLITFYQLFLPWIWRCSFRNTLWTFSIIEPMKILGVIVSYYIKKKNKKKFHCRRSINGFSEIWATEYRNYYNFTFSTSFLVCGYFNHILLQMYWYWALDTEIDVRIVAVSRYTYLIYSIANSTHNKP